MLAKMSQLSEATEKTKTGLKHTAEPGGYGRKDDEDEEGNKVKDTSAEKKGRGRPKKATQTSGEDKKYDFSAFGATGKDVKLPKWDKKKTTKHSIKEYIDQLESALNEAEQIQIKPASQMPKTPGQPQQVAGQPPKDTQVIAQGNKTLGTVDNPQLANQIKQSIGKGEMTLMPDGTMEEGVLDTLKKVGGKVLDKLGHGSDEDLIRDLQKKAGIPAHAQHGKPNMAKSEDEMDEASYSAKAARAGKDIGKPGKNFEKIATGAGGGEKGKRIAGAVLAKLRGKTNEADIPPHDSLASPLSMEESKKPDANKNGIPDYAEDGKGKNDLKKKKVKEGMDQRLQAAKLEGRAHGLKGHSHCGRNYEDMEEARMYHEGYKEGLDECYGQMPIAGGSVVDEMGMPPATVPGMANQAGGEMDEGNAFTAALKKTPSGGKFSVGGKTFTDRSSIEESPFAFESLDKQLNALLESKEEVAEGMTVSISKGQQGAPDSVSVSAQDGEADQLLSLIKSAGLGLFGGEEQNGYGAPQGSTQAPGGIEVVDDHDGMMALMKKLTGGEPGNGDYADEEGSEPAHGHEEHTDEEACNECGMAYESCGCDHGDKEMVDEVESEDQMTYNVAEGNPPDSGAADTDAEIADTQQANAAGASYDKAEAEEEAASDETVAEADEADLDTDPTEEQLDEWANEAGKDGTDAAFEADINFMTKVISGGLNKQKATGQTTIPVVSTQLNRMHSHDTTDVNESVNDWKKLAGIK